MHDLTVSNLWGKCQKVMPHLCLLPQNFNKMLILALRAPKNYSNKKFRGYPSYLLSYVTAARKPIFLCMLVSVSFLSLSFSLTFSLSPLTSLFSSVLEDIVRWYNLLFVSLFLFYLTYRIRKLLISLSLYLLMLLHFNLFFVP